MATVSYVVTSETDDEGGANLSCLNQPVRLPHSPRRLLFAFLALSMPGSTTCMSASGLSESRNAIAQATSGSKPELPSGRSVGAMFHALWRQRDQISRRKTRSSR
jgi:hypothetical protein